MAIIMVMELPGATQADYEAVSAKLTGGKSKPTAADDLPVPGLISHVAGPTADGWLIVDTWESAAAFEKFGEVMGPVMAGSGMPPVEPKVYPLFNQIR